MVQFTKTFASIPVKDLATARNILNAASAVTADPTVTTSSATVSLTAVFFTVLFTPGLVHNKVGQTGSKHVMTSHFNLGQYI